MLYQEDLRVKVYKLRGSAYDKAGGFRKSIVSLKRLVAKRR